MVSLDGAFQHFHKGPALDQVLFGPAFDLVIEQLPQDLQGKVFVFHVLHFQEEIFGEVMACIRLWPFMGLSM